jgi:hypothetical protein
MIYLWVDGEGWKEFELTDTAELEKRKISISGEAEIGSRARIGSGAVIESGTKPITICINGSRYKVSYWGEDRIDIGCQSRSIEGWLTGYTDIAKEHNFTIEEIEEYRGYVELIKLVHAKETQKAEAPEGGILAQ